MRSFALDKNVSERVASLSDNLGTVVVRKNVEDFHPQASKCHPEVNFYRDNTPRLVTMVGFLRCKETPERLDPV